MVENFSNAAQFHSKPEMVPTTGKQEKGMTQETEKQKVQRLLVSLATDTYSKSRKATKDERGKANKAEASFGVLGEAMQAKMFENIDDIDVAEPAVSFIAQDNEHRRFRPNEPKPRFKVVNGETIPIYDKRNGGLEDLNPTELHDNEFEIQTVHCRIKSAEGTLYCCTAETAKKQKVPIIIDERTFVESYILAQHSQIQADINRPTSVNPRLAEQGIKDTLTPVLVNYTEHANSPDPAHKLEPAKGVDSTKFEVETGEKLRPSGAQVRGLAERMKAYVDQDSTRTTDSAALDRYIKAIDSGEHPGAEAILEVLKIAGKPKLQERSAKIDTTVEEIDRELLKATGERKDELKRQREQLQRERQLLKNILAGTKTGNTVFELLQDMQDGKGSPELAALLNEKIANISDPTAFFELKADDLDDKTSLASIIVKHFANSRGISDEEIDRKISWFKKFLQEKGSDIAMMGIFALFQMMSSMIGEAAKNASH